MSRQQTVVATTISPQMLITKVATKPKGIQKSKDSIITFLQYLLFPPVQLFVFPRLAKASSRRFFEWSRKYPFLSFKLSRGIIIARRQKGFMDKDGCKQAESRNPDNIMAGTAAAISVSIIINNEVNFNKGIL